jgi:hypothetical protein
LPVEPKAFRVLLFLLRNPHRLITKEELLDAVWNDAAVTENSPLGFALSISLMVRPIVFAPKYEIRSVPTERRIYPQWYPQKSLALGARPRTSLDEKSLNYWPFRGFSCRKEV